MVLLDFDYQVTVKNTFITVSPKINNAEAVEQYSKSAPSRYSAFPEALSRKKKNNGHNNNNNNNNEVNTDTNETDINNDQSQTVVDEASRELKKLLHVGEESSRDNDSNGNGDCQWFFENLDQSDENENHIEKRELRESKETEFSTNKMNNNDGRNEKNEFALDVDTLEHEARTTLMIKNIPNKYSQKMLLAALEGHRGNFDFFYLPIDFKNKCNVGYAFINFIRPQYIPPFFKQFNGRTWEKFNSQKICSITYARIQGKNSMIEHFRNSRLLVEDKKCRPLIFNTENPSIEEEFPIGPNYPHAPRIPSKSPDYQFRSNQQTMSEEEILVHPSSPFMITQQHPPLHHQQQQHPWRRRK